MLFLVIISCSTAIFQNSWRILQAHGLISLFSNLCEMTLKKLLVLDVNGLLIDTYFHKEPLPEESPDAKVGNFYVYKRPFCEEFLHFCLENFIVGIWSSAREYNVKNLVDYVFGDAKGKLAFSWHQSDCTDVGLKAPGNEWKPLFMKELSKLWRKEKVDLPWSEGDYGPLNTLLVDDTPYKAVLNPPNTAIFPRSYTARDHGDNFLGGALRSYLEGIRDATSVQIYVENNPFGEPSITPESPLWSHVSKVLLKVQNVLNKVNDGIDKVLPVEDVHDDISSRGRHRRWRKRRRDEYSDPLQLMNDDTRLLNEFPSEAIELQSSENVVLPTESAVPSEEFCHSRAVEQACIPGTNGKENGMLSGPQGADIEQSKHEEPRLESLHVDYSKDDGDVGAFEGGVLAMERGQLCTAEETSHNSEQADDNADVESNIELDDIQEQQVDAHRNEGQKRGGDSGVNPLKSDWMQVEDKDECKESIAPRDDDVVHTTNKFEGPHDHLNESNCRRDKRRRFHGEPLESHHKRKHYSRGSIDYSQSWKRQRGSYEDNSTRGNGYGQYWKERRGSFQDRNRDSIDYGQSWKRDRGFHQRGASSMRPFNGRDQRRYLHNGEQSVFEGDDGSESRGTSLKRYARHGGRPIDTTPDYSWGTSGLPNSRARGDAVLDNKLPAPPYRSSGDFHARAPNLSPFGHVQGLAPSNDQWHRGFEPRVPYVRSNIRPERTEDLNMKGRHLDLAKREGEPYRDAEGSSQSYRRGSGASRLPYKGFGAPGQWHHSTSERRRQGWSPRGFSRNRENW